jgi:hypothetical protein
LIAIGNRREEIRRALDQRPHELALGPRINRDVEQQHGQLRPPDRSRSARIRGHTEERRPVVDRCAIELRFHPREQTTDIRHSFVRGVRL